MKRLTETEINTLYTYLTGRKPVDAELYSAYAKDVFLQILVETGCRVGEALMLTASSLSPQGLTIKPLKNSHSREVVLSENLLRKLRALKNPVWRKNLGDGSRASHQRAMCRHIHRLTMRLLGRRINLHALRHTAFSRLYVATKDIMLVKHWAGHKSINSTLVYVHVEATREANEAYQNLLSEQEELTPEPKMPIAKP